MHVYFKRFLQVLLMGIKMIIYMVDACLLELEFLAGEDSKKSKIFLMDPSSHKSKISITHAPTRAPHAL